MQPFDQLLGEGLFLPGPVLHTQKGIPVVSHLGDIPLPAGDLRLLVGNDPLGLFQSEAVALDEGGIVRCPNAGERSKLGLRSRRERRVVHQGAGCFDLHQGRGRWRG